MYYGSITINVESETEEDRDCKLNTLEYELGKLNNSDYLQIDIDVLDKWSDEEEIEYR